MQAADIAARHAEVVGDRPRIEPLRPDEMDEAALAMHQATRAVSQRDVVTRTLDNLPEFIGTMMRHPALLQQHTAFGIQLASGGALPPRDRELAILRIAWLCRAPYEFGEHVVIAKAFGFTAADVAALKTGSADPHWQAHEADIVRAAEELFGNAVISDATWAALAQRYDDRQLIELPLLVGHYQQLAYVFNSLRLRLHAGNAGLAAE